MGEPIKEPPANMLSKEDIAGAVKDGLQQLADSVPCDGTCGKGDCPTCLRAAHIETKMKYAHEKLDGMMKKGGARNVGR